MSFTFCFFKDLHTSTHINYFGSETMGGVLVCDVGVLQK